MNYTDKTIPIKCSECDVEEEGVDNMMKHILTTHPNYTPTEAITYAGHWMSAAYDEEDEREMKATLRHRGK